MFLSFNVVKTAKLQEKQGNVILQGKPVILQLMAKKYKITERGNTFIRKMWKQFNKYPHIL